MPERETVRLLLEDGTVLAEGWAGPRDADVAEARRAAIEAAFADLERLIAEDAADYSGAPEGLTDVVRGGCTRLLEAADVYGMGGCRLCQG